jgi:hypothetical protein
VFCDVVTGGEREVVFTDQGFSGGMSAGRRGWGKGGADRMM